MVPTALLQARRPGRGSPNGVGRPVQLQHPAAHLAAALERRPNCRGQAAAGAGAHPPPHFSIRKSCTVHRPSYLCPAVTSARLHRALTASSLRPLPGPPPSSLLGTGRAARLAAHLRAAHDVAWSLTDGAGPAPPGPRTSTRRRCCSARRRTTSARSSTVAELSGPGHRHEEAGRRAAPRGTACRAPGRFAGTHGSWTWPQTATPRRSAGQPGRPGAGRAPGSRPGGTRPALARRRGRRSWSSTTCSRTWRPACRRAWPSRRLPLS